ncbi:hypothetical protein FACS189442_3090 [Spirochaetia bacterium]|nr:hypothetical protein FACS189442_3090 [Spirochaetia bacterium]
MGITKTQYKDYGVDYDSVRGGATYTYTTSSLNNITFPEIDMLPGHNYFIVGGNGGKWFDLKAMEQAYIWKYSLDGNNLLLELPWMMPEITYKKQ